MRQRSLVNVNRDLRRVVLGGAAAALLVLPAASARAVPFGPDLGSATPNNTDSCSLAGGSSGCTAEDPLYTDMELILPNPVVNGNQTGVVTVMHVLSAATEPAQFVVVEWSGKPGLGQPFPSGVMAVSANVTLHPGLNNFNTNLPVDFRLASNGFESWSVVALSVLDGTSPIPGQLGPAYAETGLIFDNGLPLTQTVADLTVVPHNPVLSGFTPMKLLMSGDVTNTTKAPGPTPSPNTPIPSPTPPRPTPAGPAMTLVGGSARVRAGKALVNLVCGLATKCIGGVNLQDRSGAGSANVASSKAKTRKPIIYGSAKFNVGAKQRTAIQVKLSAKGRMLLKKHKSAKVWVVLTLRGSKTKIPAVRLTLKR